RHPEQLVRVAAAAANLDLTTDPGPSLAILRGGLTANDDEIREVAATCLSQYSPEDPALLIEGPDESPEDGTPANTWIFVHGTRLLKLSKWWQPGSTFFNYFTAHVRPDVYSAPDRFF